MNKYNKQKSCKGYFTCYNDNELLYFMSENDEFAFEILMKKYKPLIITRIKAFKINNQSFDDFYQECLMVLNKCAHDYREDKKMSFTTYLDNSIQYCIRNILRKEKDYYYNVVIIKDNEIDYFYKDDYKCHLEDENSVEYTYNNLSSYEEKVFKLLNEGFSIDDISKKLNKDNRSVYNTISRLKKKINKDRKKNKDLSLLEERVFDKYSLGFKPKEIAYLLGKDVETIYNAIKRLRKKKYIV